jgi:hypothetical protein
LTSWKRLFCPTFLQNLGADKTREVTVEVFVATATVVVVVEIAGVSSGSLIALF